VVIVRFDFTSPYMPTEILRGPRISDRSPSCIRKVSDLRGLLNIRGSARLLAPMTDEVMRDRCVIACVIESVTRIEMRDWCPSSRSHILRQ